LARPPAPVAPLKVLLGGRSVTADVIRRYAAFAEAGRSGHAVARPEGVEPAVLGVVLAAVITVVVAEGAWDEWDLAIGLYLVAFLRLRHHAVAVTWLAYLACLTVVGASLWTLL
jgi:hypothetical protein